MQHSASVTLFTRPNCSLCENAKTVISSVSQSRSFEYTEVNVMCVGQESWKRLYEFDTPVVRILMAQLSHLSLTLLGPCSTCFPHLCKAQHHHGGSKAYAPVQ